MSDKDDIKRQIGIGQAEQTDKLPPLQDFKVSKIYPAKPATTPPLDIDHDDDCDSTD